MFHFDGVETTDKRYIGVAVALGTIVRVKSRWSKRKLPLYKLGEQFNQVPHSITFHSWPPFFLVKLFHVLLWLLFKLKIGLSYFLVSVKFD